MSTHTTSFKWCWLGKQMQSLEPRNIHNSVDSWLNVLLFQVFDSSSSTSQFLSAWLVLVTNAVSLPVHVAWVLDVMTHLGYASADLIQHAYNQLKHLQFKADRVSRNDITFWSINVILRLWSSKTEGDWLNALRFKKCILIRPHVNSVVGLKIAIFNKHS